MIRERRVQGRQRKEIQHMNAERIARCFAAMGARFKAEGLNRWETRGYVVDILRDKRGEFFELRAPDDLREALEVIVAQVVPADRHLLLMVRNPENGNRLDRFLCGHDERAWFIAAVPSGASSVAQAKEALRPEAVQEALSRVKVSAVKRNARKNRAFRRQGEWFFLPVPWLTVDANLVLRHEPIRRGGGKPHIVQNLYRSGGERVYVCREHPNGLTEAQYVALVRREPAKARLSWRLMRRNMAVFARGEIRHPDHRTITLPIWHRVVMNTEDRTEVKRNLAFLD